MAEWKSIPGVMDPKLGPCHVLFYTSLLFMQADYLPGLAPSTIARLGSPYHTALCIDIWYMVQTVIAIA